MYMLSIKNELQFHSNIKVNRGVMGKLVDRYIVENWFEIQSRYYDHYQTNTPSEIYELSYSPSSGLNSTTTVHL